jgi:hypothetical protein
MLPTVPLTVVLLPAPLLAPRLDADGSEVVAVLSERRYPDWTRRPQDARPRTGRRAASRRPLQEERIVL